jgi:hypothetical protein
MTREQNLIKDVRRHYDSSDALDEVLALALEALELQALVPTDEEMDVLDRACDFRPFDVMTAEQWLDRVRAWKGCGQ